MPAHRLLKLGIGHCPEGRRVIGRQSVADNLILGAYLRRDTSGIAADLKRCYGLIPRLAERRQQLAGALSGGEQQMLEIANSGYVLEAGQLTLRGPAQELLANPSLRAAYLGEQ